MLSTNAGDATAVSVDAAGLPIAIDAQVSIGAMLTGALDDADNIPLAGQQGAVETLDAASWRLRRPMRPEHSGFR